MPVLTGMVELWITSQNAPLNTKSPPSVMIKAGIRCAMISLPINDHIPTANRKPAPIATGAGSWCSKTSTLAMPPIKPTPLPTDRSIIPGSSTSSMPSASVAVTASSIDSIDRLRGLRNLSDARAKNAQIRIRPMAIEKSRMESLLLIGAFRSSYAPSRRPVCALAWRRRGRMRRRCAHCSKSPCGHSCPSARAIRSRPATPPCPRRSGG